MQTQDNYWTYKGPGSGNCIIPGTTATFPYNDVLYNYCGAQSYALTSNSSSFSGRYGSIGAYRDYNDRLFITVSLDGSSSTPGQGQLYLDVPPPSTALPATQWVSSQIFLWTDLASIGQC